MSSTLGISAIRVMLLTTMLVAWGCDESGGQTQDAGDDLADATDTGIDPTPPCPYPAEPYSFAAVGDITPMMTWPSGIGGSHETLPANLGYIRCGDGVKSVFLFVFGFS